MINDSSFKEHLEGDSYDFWQNLTEGELLDLDFFTACANGEFDYIKKFLQSVSPKSKTDIVNKRNKGGWSPLMYVCYVGNHKITDLLIREGADVLCEEEKCGCTPLILASTSANVSLVKCLVENNAALNHVDKHGRTALFHAAEHGQTKIVEYLLSVSADVSIRQNGTGYTPFMEAAKQGHEAVFNAFLDYKVDLDLVCYKGYTARELAEQWGSIVIVNMIDNHRIKSRAIRYEADLSDFGMDEIKQPYQKVNKWLNDHNPDHFIDNILPNKVSEIPSLGIPIDRCCKAYSVEDSLGKSLGDSTIVDSDRTPLGTPVDSMFQQYMSGDLFPSHSTYDYPTLETFLKDLSLEKYIKTFQDAHIDFDLLVGSTEEDFKELGIVLGPRRKLKMAIDNWKNDSGWDTKYANLEVNNVAVKLADVHSKLRHISSELVREKEARALLEAEQMEGRARRNHMYFMGEKVIRACKELLITTKAMKKHVETVKALTNENKKDEVKSRLKELHKLMSEDTVNANNTTETILRRMEKLISDDLTELSSNSDSPESSCTSFSKSESGSGVIE